MANISTVFDQKNIFQGPAVVKLDASTISGGSPSEIGGVAEVSLDVGLEILQVEQGFPRTLMAQFVKRKTVKVSFKSLETGDYSLWRYALAAATYSTTGTGGFIHNVDFGEQNTMTACRIQLIIINCDGFTEEMNLWKCMGGSEGIKRDFADEDVHGPTYTFNVLRCTQDWWGSALATSKAFFHAQVDKQL